MLRSEKPFLESFPLRYIFLLIFSSSAICAELVVLDPGAAFILSVIESLAVEAQILMLVTPHCLCFCVSLHFYYLTPPFV